MKILFFTDTHNSEKAPRSRSDSYMENILGKQEQMIKPANSCDLVIHGGDVFHQKRNVSFKLWNRVAEIYRELGPMMILAGNHDFNQTEEELEHNHVAALSKLPNVDMVLWGSAVYGGVSFTFYGGGDFFSFKELKSYVRSAEPKRDNMLDIGVFHSSIQVEVKEYQFPTITNILFLYKKFDVIMLGHLHDQQYNSMIRDDPIYIVAPGAISRGVLKEDESFDRSVGYSIVEEEKGEVKNVEFVKLDYKPAEEVFDVQTHEEEKETRRKAQDLVEFIGKMESPKVLNNENLIEKINKLDIDENVRKKAIEILKDLL